MSWGLKPQWVAISREFRIVAPRAGAELRMQTESWCRRMQTAKRRNEAMQIRKFFCETAAQSPKKLKRAKLD